MKFEIFVPLSMNFVPWRTAASGTLLLGHEEPLDRIEQKKSGREKFLIDEGLARLLDLKISTVAE